MFFDYAIGNPPYQVFKGNRINGQGKSISVYEKFQKIALTTSNNTMMIYPASWQVNTSIYGRGLGSWLKRNGIFYSKFYLARDVFGSSIMNDYPISIVGCKNNYNGSIKINDTEFMRSDETWVDTKTKEILIQCTANFKKLSLTVEHLSSIANIEVSPIHFSMNKDEFVDPVLIYVKKSFNTYADSDDYYLEREDVLKHCDPVALEKFQVGIPQAIFIISRAFIKIANKPSRGFNSKVFGKDYTAGRTYMKMIEFDSLQEAVNFENYFNSKPIRVLTTLNGNRNTFGNFIPDLEDYSSDNDLFKTNDELNKNHMYYGLNIDERLYKLFALTDDEIITVENNE